MYGAMDENEWKDPNFLVIIARAVSVVWTRRPFVLSLTADAQSVVSCKGFGKAMDRLYKGMVVSRGIRLVLTEQEKYPNHAKTLASKLSFKGS
jgi:hypothetical protein